MSTATELRRLASALEGTEEAPHFDRLALRVARIYATIAADERSANLKLTPDEQALKCTTAPDAFSAVPGAWGAQGWTTVRLDAVSQAELHAALRLAWSHAQARNKPPTPRRQKA